MTMQNTATAIPAAATIPAATRATRAACKAMRNAFWNCIGTGKYGMRTVYNVYPVNGTVPAAVAMATHDHVADVCTAFRVPYDVQVFVQNGMYGLRVNSSKLHA